MSKQRLPPRGVFETPPVPLGTRFTEENPFGWTATFLGCSETTLRTFQLVQNCSDNPIGPRRVYTVDRLYCVHGRYIDKEAFIVVTDDTLKEDIPNLHYFWGIIDGCCKVESNDGAIVPIYVRNAQ